MGVAGANTGGDHTHALIKSTAYTNNVAGWKAAAVEAKGNPAINDKNKQTTAATVTLSQRG